MAALAAQRRRGMGYGSLSHGRLALLISIGIAFVVLDGTATPAVADERSDDTLRAVQR